MNSSVVAPSAVILGPMDLAESLPSISGTNADVLASPPPRRARNYWRNFAGFWIIGLMNNSSYVIMNAGATEISKGGVGLVYLANIVPCFFINLSAPYWFDKVSCNTRVSSHPAIEVSGL